jgi:hypothetical protein
MRQPDHFKLHGSYRTPRFRLGAKVKCRVRGELTIVGVTDAPIPWPLGKHGRSTKSLVVYGDLARAIRLESVSAICHWFGVHDVTVWKWRKALGVPERNYGTRKLWEALAATGSYWNGIRAGIARAGDPIRRAKIATALRGRRRPKSVVEKVRRAHLGTKRSTITRNKMKEAWRRRGKPKPTGETWRPWEDDLVRTRPVAEVVR